MGVYNMKRFFRKFKNIHFLILTGLICFYSFYVPVAIFTTYTDIVPIWTIPFFIIGSMFPLWFNEFMWRTSKFGSDTYIMFHEIHFEDRKWKKRTMNPFVLFKTFGKWCLKSSEFIIMSIVNLAALFYGFADILHEVVFPFTPFYLINALWWISLIKVFAGFRNAVEEGEISYGRREQGVKTHFSDEWHLEMKRIREREEELRKMKRDL
jgi:hypothetical protein